VISFLLTRQSDPAAQPIGEPDDADPWFLDWHEPTRRWFVRFLDNTTTNAGDERDGLDSLLAFVAYLGCPVRIVGNGRGVAPELVILDVVVQTARESLASVVMQSRRLLIDALIQSVRTYERAEALNMDQTTIDVTEKAIGAARDRLLESLR
jgi:hypothetical protein